MFYSKKRTDVTIDNQAYVELTITLPKEAVEELDKEAKSKDFNSAEDLIEDKFCSY